MSSTDSTAQAPVVAAGPTGAADRRGWLPGIEAIRGIAALMVVLHHSWSLSTMPHFRGYQIIEGLGSLGVNLFFLLSGFLLADTFWRGGSERRLRIYWVRRAFRIMPAYYVNIGVLFLFFAQHALLFSEQGAKQLLANVTFTHYLLPGTSSSLNVNGALWTMTAEFLLYLLLPVMALPFLRAPKTAFLVLVTMGLGWRLVVALRGDWLRDLYFSGVGPGAPIESLYLARQFFGLVPIFALGIGLKWLQVNGHLDRLRERLPQRMTVVGLLLALVPPVLILVFTQRASFYTHWIWFTGFDFAMSVLLLPLLVLASQPGWIPRNWLHRLSIWIGDRSYSLYIWHFPIILSVYGRGPLVAPADVTHIWWRLTLIIGLSLLAAHLSFTLIEKPGMAWGRDIAKKIAAGRTTNDVTRGQKSPDEALESASPAGTPSVSRTPSAKAPTTQAQV